MLTSQQLTGDGELSMNFFEQCVLNMQNVQKFIYTLFPVSRCLQPLFKETVSLHCVTKCSRSVSRRSSFPQCHFNNQLCFAVEKQPPNSKIVCLCSRLIGCVRPQSDTCECIFCVSHKRTHTHSSVEWNISVNRSVCDRPQGFNRQQNKSHLFNIV